MNGMWEESYLSGIGAMGRRAARRASAGGQRSAAIPRVFQGGGGVRGANERIKAQWQAIFDALGAEAYEAMVRRRMAARRR